MTRHGYDVRVEGSTFYQISTIWAPDLARLKKALMPLVERGDFRQITVTPVES